jgi:hypothetical protein
VRAKHYFLILTAVCAVIGFTSGDSIYLDIGRPLAGIFFGLFLIATIFEKESDLLDEQLGIARTTEPLVEEDPSSEAIANATLTHAPSH